MSFILVIATLGAGVGLTAGVAFNLRLARALGTPLAVTLVNFAFGAMFLLTLWGLGLDGARPSAMPPPWMLSGGLLGASYVTLNLIGASRLGVGVSAVATTLGQMLSALLIGGAGWLGQAHERPSLAGMLSAALMVGAVLVLARSRAASTSHPNP